MQGSTQVYESARGQKKVSDQRCYSIKVSNHDSKYGDDCCQKIPSNGLIVLLTCFGKVLKRGEEATAADSLEDARCPNQRGQRRRNRTGKDANDHERPPERNANHDHGVAEETAKLLPVAQARAPRMTAMPM